MNKHNSIFIILILLGLVLPLISAEYLPHKQNTNLTFSITSNNGTQCNVTSYDYPSGTIFINQNMTRHGQTFNASIDEGNFTSIGSYCFNIVCTDDSTIETGSLCREVTPSGSQISSGKSIGLFGSLILMIVFSLLFFFIAFKTESSVAKMFFYSFAAIGGIMTILFTVIVMQQTLFGFESILIGIESFWFVTKTLVTVGGLAFGVIIFMVMIKAWKIKRGLIDID